MEFPISGVTTNPWLLVLIGFIVGILGGFFGVGGAFIATPALNLLGFPMAYAIGTDLAHILGKSIMSTALHRKLGNVDFRAGLTLVVGTLPGVELGSRLVMWLERIGHLEPAVRWTYVAVLTATALYMLNEFRDYLNWRAGRETAADDAGGSGFPARLAQAVSWRPVIALPVSGIPAISVWVLVGIGLVTGFMAGFMGVGGGFLRVPALTYVVGMPMRVAVGTDLLEVLFSGGWGTITYALKGRVDVLAALFMLTGAAVGTQFGVMATCFARYRIKLYFAITMLLTAVSVIMKETGLQAAGLGLLFTTATVMSLMILRLLAAGLLRQRRHAVKL